MCNHVPPRLPRRQATPSACLGLGGSNPRSSHSVSTLPFADASSALKDRCAQTLSHSQSGATYSLPCPSFSLPPSSLHADSRHSSLTVRPCVPMLYKSQRHGGSLLYRQFF